MTLFLMVNEHDIVNMRNSLGLRARARISFHTISYITAIHDCPKILKNRYLGKNEERRGKMSD